MYILARGVPYFEIDWICLITKALYNWQAYADNDEKYRIVRTICYTLNVLLEINIQRFFKAFMEIFLFHHQ